MKHRMKLSDFDYELPPELIAQEPLSERDASRMLVLDRKSGAVQNSHFKNLPDFLTNKDLLIFNQSKVVKARLLGTRPTGGKVEVFLLKKLSDGVFEALLKMTASNKIGAEFTIGEKLNGKVLRAADAMSFIVELVPVVAAVGGEKSVDTLIDELGHIPLPPYITREDSAEDSERYQTVYARERGSVAAPTAGLHFTPKILEDIQQKGVQLGYVTLHVGLGTFQPIKVENISDHQMHTENFFLEESLWKKIQETKKNGGRVIAVGTTTTRTLESYARGFREETNLFLKPGEEFKVVDGMLTNFHQPKSSLLVMLSAFVGREKILNAYEFAKNEKYRFFSYGDCMLILD